MIISILEQSSCCQLKILYTTLQETNLHKHQKNNHKPVGFFFNLITRIRNEKNRVIALHENPSNTYEQNDPGPISIYTHVYIYIRL